MTVLNIMYKWGAIACLGAVLCVKQPAFILKKPLYLRWKHFVLARLLILSVMRGLALVSRVAGMPLWLNAVRNVWTSVSFLLKWPFYFLGGVGWLMMMMSLSVLDRCGLARMSRWVLLASCVIAGGVDLLLDTCLGACQSMGRFFSQVRQVKGKALRPGAYYVFLGLWWAVNSTYFLCAGVLAWQVFLGVNTVLPPTLLPLSILNYMPIWALDWMQANPIPFIALLGAGGLMSMALSANVLRLILGRWVLCLPQDVAYAGCMRWHLLVLSHFENSLSPQPLAFDDSETLDDRILDQVLAEEVDFLRGRGGHALPLQGASRF